MRISFPIALLSSVLVVGLVAGPADAQPEPKGERPRLLLDDAAEARLRALAKKPGTAVHANVQLCERLGKDFDGYAGYQGFRFAKNLSSCLLAYRATGDAGHARTALRYFQIMLDDYQKPGDGAGGDDVVTHNTGYAMRTFGVYPAIAYDWLHDAPGMTGELRAHARKRFAAWSEWYRTKGYLNETPGANYNAGWVMGATMMAVAQAGEAGVDGAKLWRHVVDDIFGKMLVPAVAEGGGLAGGDWPEGWQYGALSVLEYAIAARALSDHGVSLPGFPEWGDALFYRHIYGLTPGGTEHYIGGDTGAETVHLPASLRTLAAVIIGPSSPRAKAWAAAEIERLDLSDDEMPFFAGLAEVYAPEPVPFEHAKAPTSYLAAGMGNFYTRTSWSRDAVFSVLHCAARVAPDHQFVNAGNLVITRGADDLLIDPSPYGSRSTMTSNAPAIAASYLPESYRPSQGYWSEHTRFEWARQTESGLAVARCDYADQFRFRNEGNDVEMAIRDFVLVPDGDEQAVVIVDRARTQKTAGPLELRFRTLSPLSGKGDQVSTTVGASALHVRKVASSGGEPELGTYEKGRCYDRPKTEQGRCALGRFAGHEMKLVVPGHTPMAIHVLDAVAVGAAPSTVALQKGDGHQLVLVTRGDSRAAIVVGEAIIGNGGAGKADGSLTYTVPAGVARHVVLDAPVGPTGRSTVSADKTAAGCQVSVRPEADGGVNGRPLVLAVGDDCSVREEARQTSPLVTQSSAGDGTRVTGVTPGTAGTPGATSGTPSKRSSKGCGGCGTAPPATAALALVIGVAVCRRRR